MTVGTGSESNRGWVTQLIDSLNTSNHTYSLNPPGGVAGTYGIGELYEYVNEATNGHQSSDILPDSSVIDGYFTTIPDTAFLSVWMGDNDLALTSITADSLYNIIYDYCRDRQLHGWKVLVATIIRRAGGVVDSTTYENRRLAVNDSIRTNYQEFADGLLDFGDIAELQDPYDVTYWATDKIHLNTDGYTLLADLAQDTVKAHYYLKDYAYLSTASFRALNDNKWYRLTFDAKSTGIISGTDINNNGGFEADTNFIDWGTPTTNERSNTQAHSGTYSRHIIGDESGDGFTDTVRFGGSGASNLVEILSGRWYEVSFWYYIVSGTLSFGDSFGILNVASYTDDSTGAWISYVDTIDATSTTAERFTFTTSGGAGEFYIDDYSVQQIETPDLIVTIAGTEKKTYHLSPGGESISHIFIHDNTGDDNFKFSVSNADTVLIDNIYLGK